MFQVLSSLAGKLGPALWRPEHFRRESEQSPNKVNGNTGVNPETAHLSLNLTRFHPKTAHLPKSSRSIYFCGIS
ncbi:hypothetical protein Niako_3656 [Niastella koreensis GR20-10]|uniref:Uncharacterized protein n=1 Tax=Niastella koreensis (strain DSM 17620 / KACC 11465 / NBRC 106392 / GR20-10) TaxID=700598 RepID=G8TPW0_NIAKG|nr:hypothetical protein Niako_3656 [Niastella koreensis GR20-10]